MPQDLFTPSPMNVRGGEREAANVATARTGVAGTIELAVRRSLRQTRPIFHASLARTGRSAYVITVSSGTMVINARAISGSDPGAVPGGSTNILRLGIMGPKQDRRTSKDVSFYSAGRHRYRLKQASCKRQQSSGCSRCVSSAKYRNLSPSALQC